MDKPRISYPWTAEGDCSGWYIKSTEGEVLAHIKPPAQWDQPYYSVEDGWRMAKLMAAAPELLDSLMTLDDVLHKLHSKGVADCDDELKTSLGLLRKLTEAYVPRQVSPIFETHMAFPLSHHEDQTAQLGMTLRDYYASKAMQGLIANGQSHDDLMWWVEEDGEGKTTYQIVAMIAHELADAMLRERNK